MSDILITKNVIDQAIENGYSVAVPEDYHETVHPFRPVKCLQSDIDNRIQPTNGYVYFTLDTQKIFYGTGTEFLPMGGSSGIYYANKTFGEDAGDDMTFSIDDFESESLPTNINDLIINVGGNEVRNGFYQVIEIFAEENFVNTRYLPVGGGGGGGATGPAVVGEIKIGYISPQSESVLVGEPCIISFNVEITDANGDLVPSGGTSTWTINNKRYPGKAIVNGYNEFDIGPYLSSVVDVNAIKLTVSADTGGTINNVATKQWSVVAIDLELEWNWQYSSDYYFSDDTFMISCIPYGNIASEVVVWFDDNQLDAHVFNVPAKNMGNVLDMTFNSLEYGTHTVSMYLGATINDNYYKTKVIQHELTFIKGGISPILTVPFYETTASQYETIQIPFLVYDPNNIETKVDFLVNDIVITTDTYNRENLHFIPYTFGISGTLKLGLRCGSAIWDTTLTVAPLDLDVDEVSGYVFKFKASDFSGNTEIKNWENNGITLTTSENFDWVNGGLQSEIDENGHLRKYIGVKNGTRLTINYDLFGNEGFVYGKNFKIIFKATNCYDYDAQILDCFYETNSLSGGIGIKMNAQNATFCSNEIKMVTQYYEDSYIELEAEIFKRAPRNTVNPDNFMMFWIDGVPANVKVYGYTDSFIQPSKRKIVIGSDDCDVQIYLIKVYEKQLSENNHLDNFIIDAPNTEEMLKRFKRNDILDNNGDISYIKLVEKNPDCYAHLYEIPQMCYVKKPPITGCTYQQYYKDSKNPALTAEDVEIRVQGTSSIAYGAAAFNIDTEFTSGLTDKDGNHLDKWGMSETAIPVNYFCTKVNVASCENANNALNQEWYNKYQPYWDGHRRKLRDDRKIVRDCMEFIPGVLFIKDNNPLVYEIKEGNKKEDYYLANCFTGLPSEAKYVNNPYFKQYSICNMGNSKDNIEVFHDLDNPKACCVEIGNNQNVEHWMTVKIDTSTFDLDEPYYEFRYPDGNDKASQQQKQAWVDFVNWMASCDPNPYDAVTHPHGYTGEKLPNGPVTYGSYTFKGFDPPGFEGEGSRTPVSLGPTNATKKAVTVSEYNGTYTNDTYEYRMAKMLHECEDHLVMDSVVYHFLFILRHTMVDNVAKNTFWSTEDLQHWDLTKNYDNDTADGNNNTGFLTYSYGIEAMDNESATKKVFNATDSVWFTFIYGLNEAQEGMYQQYADNAQFNAWDANTYLDMFKSFQNIIPERCWIYDYFRKYIRPRRLGLDDDTYLNRLEGGKKTHQRQQYEIYNDFYFNTKFLTQGIRRNDVIDLRAMSGPGYDENYVTPVSYYINCYAVLEYGGNVWRQKVERGTKCNLPVGKINPSAGDATTYYGGASMIQEFEGIEFLYPQYISLTPAIRLRTLQVGLDDPDYYNDNLTSANFSNNIMLESASVPNSGARDTSMLALDLNKLKSLKYLNIKGSTYPGLILADNGLIEELHINALTSLQMTNLEKLKVFTFDEALYNTLNTIHIDNCPLINTYDLVLNSNIISYYLGHVNWEITNKNDVEINNNNITAIKILKKLMEEERIPESGYTTQTALTGTLTINIPDCNVDEYYLYELYHNTFPNLNIIFGKNIGNVTYANKIRFFTNNLTNSEILYEVLIHPTNNTLPLSVLTSSQGPTGIEMGEPIRESEVDKIFTWDPTDDKPDWITHEGTEEKKFTHIEMLNYTPTTNMDFIPNFIESPRFYRVILKDSDKEIVNTTVEFNTKYNVPSFLYKEHEIDKMRWMFYGWISPTDYLSGNKNPTFLATPENNQITITSDFYAYAFYKEEDCTIVPTNLNYFKFSNMVDNGQYGVGYEISIKDEYRNILQGKITLPAKYNGQNIITALNFRNMPLITHVYFEGGSTYTQIGEYAFACDNKNTILTPVLQAVYLPSSIKRIGSHAFYEQTELLDVNLDNLTELLIIESDAFRNYNRSGSMKIRCSKLPDKISSIGHSAFYNCKNITITELPASLLTLSPWAFAECPNIKIIEFGTDALPGLKKLDTSTFYESGSSVTGEIFIKNSITEFGFNSGPFERYGSNITAVLARPISEYNNGEGVTASTLGVMEIKAPDYEEVIE